MNMHKIYLSLGLNSSMKVNDTSYDTNITMDLNNFNLSLKTQYLQTEGDLKLKILSFIEDFDLIKVTIPDQKLQEIWDLVMNTKMMQDFLIEDIVHHYFIKSLPEIDLTNLATVPINKKSYAIRILDIPDITQTNSKQFLGLSLGIQEVPSPKGLKFKSVSHFLETLKQAQNEMKSLQPKMIADQGTEDGDSIADIQMNVSAAILSLVGTNMFDAINIDLNQIDAIKSQLTFGNLRLVFPSLDAFYSDDSELVNLQLAINIQSEEPLFVLTGRSGQFAVSFHA